MTIDSGASTSAPRDLLLDLVLDPMDPAAFDAHLEAMAHRGVCVPAPRPVAVGMRCGMQVSTRDGRFRRFAETVVTRCDVWPTGVELEVRITKLGRLRHTAQPTDDSLPPVPLGEETGEGATAVVSDEESRALAAKSRPDERISLRLRGLFQAGRRALVTNPSSPLPSLAPFDSLGSYQVLKHLGGGGMADVYLARSTLRAGVDKLVALKTGASLVDDSSACGALFRQEARVSAALQHPHLVQVFDFGESAGRPYLIMEYLHGRDLSAVLRRLAADACPPSPSFAVAVTIALCRALEYLHDKRDLDGQPLGLVHRDISPGNVVVTRDGAVKLMDMGVVSARGRDLDDSSLLVGKLPYMTPAQARGDPPTPAWDLYAVGVILYELLTLRRPQQAAPRDYLELEVLRVHRGPPSAFNGAIPPELDEIAVCATQLEGSAGFASAAALRRALEGVQAYLPAVDVALALQELFGSELDREERAIEALVAEARRRTRVRVPALLRPLARALRFVRRLVVYTRVYQRLARRPRALRAVAAALAVAVIGGGAAAGRWARQRDLFAQRLERGDAQILAGRLVGPGDTPALAQLLAARDLRPDDRRALERLRLLGTTLERLGAAALERGDFAEAVAHLEAAQRAQPDRPSTRELLAEVRRRVAQRPRAAASRRLTSASRNPPRRAR